MFSDRRGFLLADGLIALLIVSLSALIISALVQMKSSSMETIREVLLESEEGYESRISEIDSCVIECTEEIEDAED